MHRVNFVKDTCWLFDNVQVKNPINREWMCLVGVHRVLPLDVLGVGKVYIKSPLMIARLFRVLLHYVHLILANRSAF